MTPVYFPVQVHCSQPLFMGSRPASPRGLSSVCLWWCPSCLIRPSPQLTFPPDVTDSCSASEVWSLHLLGSFAGALPLGSLFLPTARGPRLCQLDSLLCWELLPLNGQHRGWDQRGHNSTQAHFSFGHRNTVRSSPLAKLSRTSVLYSKAAGHWGTLNNHRSLRYEVRRLTRFMTCGRSVTMRKLVLIPVLPFFLALCSLPLPAHTQNGKIKGQRNSRWQWMEIQNKMCHLPTLPKQQVFNHLASQNIRNTCAYIWR